MFKNKHISFYKNDNRSGTVAHAYNPSTLGGRGGRTALVQEFETNLGNKEKKIKLLSLQKKIF